MLLEEREEMGAGQEEKKQTKNHYLQLEIPSYTSF